MEGATESVKRRRNLDDIGVGEGRREPSRKTEEECTLKRGFERESGDSSIPGNRLTQKCA